MLTKLTITEDDFTSALLAIKRIAKSDYYTCNCLVATCIKRELNLNFVQVTYNPIGDIYFYTRNWPDINLPEKVRPYIVEFDSEKRDSMLTRLPFPFEFEVNLPEKYNEL